MDRSFCYDWDQGETLSARCDDNSCLVRERTAHRLLRPVFINAVEVGYAYSQCDRDRRLNVRGVTIALWYFISRGHQALALLPYCFKSYADKSSSWPELMSLFKMNLVEFTPGFGSDKYTEVNRILAARADEVGGCIVARSQMHKIVEERPHLGRTVETRLLMPSFNGDDIIFPVDGPLGRSGPSLQETLECGLAAEEEWGRCSHHQLTLNDQRIWLQRLANIIPEQLSWNAIHSALDTFRPSTPLPSIELPKRPSHISHAKNRPPETNPVDGKGFSYTRAALRRSNPEAPTIYGVSATGPMTTYRDVLGLATAAVNAEYVDLSERTDPFLPEYMRTGSEASKLEPRFAECAPPLPNFLGNVGSIYRICPREESQQQAPPPPSRHPLPVQQQPSGVNRQELVEKLSVLFGMSKASRIVSKNPTVTNVNLLIEFALNDLEGDTTGEERTEQCHSQTHLADGVLIEF